MDKWPDAFNPEQIFEISDIGTFSHGERVHNDHENQIRQTSALEESLEAPTKSPQKGAKIQTTP